VVKGLWKLIVLVAVVTVVAAGLAVAVAAGDDDPRGLRIMGGATTMVEGGTGAPDFVPVLTKLAFHWDGKEGNLECLALAPSDPAGDPGSGDFDTNVMYVTGPVTSARVRGETAVLSGTATVTGIGEGEDLPFRLTVHRGGSGTTAVLEVSGLVFREIVLEGAIRF
jgi:hypothetical protein